MRTEHEPPRTYAHELRELEEEREIDFGRLGRRLALRWWLVAAAVAAGAIVGYLTSLGGGDVYVARTTVYLGQPTSPSGSAQIPSLATNPSTVNEIVHSQSVVDDVARKVGVAAGELRRGISTKTVATTGTGMPTRQGQNPLVQIAVRGPWRDQSTRAANLLAAAVVKEVSGYVDAKVRALRERLAGINEELTSIERRLDELERAAARAGLPPTERLTLVSLIGLSEQRRGQLIAERTDKQELITLAEEVERSAPINKARAARVPAQSPRSAIVVGAFIGLLAGVILALFWDPLVGHRRA
ncbi:MAG: Wzz/FepE/Etk N-terminal domain-containing protein [Actinomycetota bacterium]|nr:Wzz/FepE/Etk N-terminal domain-containing protein [Actinomycetota bacterium]